MIAPGQYLAMVNTWVLEGTGTVRLKATLDFGEHTLAEATIILDGGVAPPLQLAFDVPNKTANKFEVICDITGLRQIAVSDLIISERPGAPSPLRAPAIKRKLLGLIGW